jgi:hypothetical protein
VRGYIVQSCVLLKSVALSVSASAIAVTYNCRTIDRKLSSMMRALLILVSLFPAGLPAAPPNPPKQLCIDSNCTSSPVVGSEGVKWHPGHYMLVLRGESIDLVMSKRIPEVCAEPAIQGLQYRANWPDLETNEGQYNFQTLDDLYNALAACKKRLVVEVWAVKFSSTDSSNVVPSYILTGAQYNGGIAATSSGYIARLWEAPVMDRLIALYSALAGRYDSAPYFEAIVFSETATSGVTGSYTTTAWIEQLNRAVAALRSSWVHTNIVVYNNFIQGATESQLSSLETSLRGNRVGTGGPDVLPPPHTLRGEMIYRGELGGHDFRGQLPAMFAVQAPELGGKEGLFTPRQLYDHCVGTNWCSHMFWIRNTTKGGSEQMWDTGLLPFLRSNPHTRESCPSSYAGCVQ